MKKKKKLYLKCMLIIILLILCAFISYLPFRDESKDYDYTTWKEVEISSYEVTLMLPNDWMLSEEDGKICFLCDSEMMMMETYLSAGDNQFESNNFYREYRMVRLKSIDGFNNGKNYGECTIEIADKKLLKRYVDVGESTMIVWNEKVSDEIIKMIAASQKSY